MDSVYRTPLEGVKMRLALYVVFQNDPTGMARKRRRGGDLLGKLLESVRFDFLLSSSSTFLVKCDCLIIHFFWMLLTLGIQWVFFPQMLLCLTEDHARNVSELFIVFKYA
ncbi:hypothetical protein ACMD2_03912 [Ananas comosus]|uniref:Uncharacterized protein n=1 Tax=Ananas comosus TaxID=4615 RepID=A0A199V6B6_ANACO|nr:hypothetical protein ACMD2_03912 [Ananas comosus]